MGCRLFLLASVGYAKGCYEDLDKQEDRGEGVHATLLVLTLLSGFRYGQPCTKASVMHRGGRIGADRPVKRLDLLLSRHHEAFHLTNLERSLAASQECR